MCSPAATELFLLGDALTTFDPRAPSPRSDLTELRAPGSLHHPPDHQDCLNSVEGGEGSSASSHYYNTRGQLHVSEITDVEKVQQQEEDGRYGGSAGTVCSLRSWGVWTHRPRGLWLSRRLPAIPGTRHTHTHTEATRESSVTVDTHTCWSLVMPNCRGGGLSAGLTDLYIFVVYKQTSRGGGGRGWGGWGGSESRSRCPPCFLLQNQRGFTKPHIYHFTDTSPAHARLKTQNN